jgi:hypothetical protein
MPLEKRHCRRFGGLVEEEQVRHGGGGYHQASKHQRFPY